MEDKNVVLTPEQKKEAQKVLTKARWTLFFLGMKCVVALFAANLFCTIIEKSLFADPDPDTVLGFRLVCVLINSFLITAYFIGKTKECDDIVNKSIKEILKK